MALLNYRSPTELNDRFDRSWQSGINPLGGGGRFAVESYLDFHGNKFTRRFDANSYIVLVDAMNSHDIGRDRDGVAAALRRATGLGLVLGIDSDRLFPVPDQQVIARHLPNSLERRRADRDLVSVRTRRLPHRGRPRRRGAHPAPGGLMPRPHRLLTTVAAGALVLLAAVGCAAAPPPQLPEGVTADVLQRRTDIADGKLAISVTNGSDAPFTLTRADYRAPRFAEPMIWDDGERTLAPGRTLDLRIAPSALACEHRGRPRRGRAGVHDGGRPHRHPPR